MIELARQAKNILSTVLPLTILLIAVLTTWGLVKWGKRISEAFKGLFESPERIIFLLVVAALFLWIYFKYINPLLQPL